VDFRKIKLHGAILVLILFLRDEVHHLNIFTLLFLFSVY